MADRTLIPASEPVEAVISLVLDGLVSPRSKAVYRTALRRFVEWRETVPSGPMSKQLVQTYRTDLLESGLAPATVNVHLAAIRKLAQEAADNGYMPQSVAAAIGRIPGVPTRGRRLGKWLTLEQAQELLAMPDVSTLAGQRDRALLAVMLGGGLRRAEVVALTVEHFQKRSGRWVILDLEGKGHRVRTVPIPEWTRTAVVNWLTTADISEGFVFRRVRSGQKLGEPLTAKGLYTILGKYGVLPHDLRRTWARLAYDGGAPIRQIQLALGHASIKTTETYLGVHQDLLDAPCDYLGLEV